MERDMECLRDLWAVIDPTSPIGRRSRLTEATRRRHDADGAKKLAARRKAAADRADSLLQARRPIPKPLAHFLRGVPSRSGGQHGKK